MSTIKNAEGRWPSILNALGIDPKFLRKNIHQPCPFCEGKDRFRFDDKNGSGSYHCSGCSSGYGIHFVMKWFDIDMPEASRKVDKIIGSNPEPVKAQSPGPDPRLRLNRVKSMMQPVQVGDAVDLYLKSRNLYPAAGTKTAKAQPYYEGGKKVGEFDAMAHIVRTSNNEPATIHLTYLDGRGGKADVSSPKKVLPPCRDWKGGYIRLYETMSVMGIAEGVETAMAARMMNNMPVWACINSVELERFTPPATVKMLYVFADNDAGFAGQAAAYNLARRLKKEAAQKKKTIEVEVMIPGIVGQDFADVWYETA